MPAARIDTPPRLCPAHTEMRRKWRLVVYNPARPSEWPGGSHIMDSRTTHAQRRADWERKTAEHITLTEQICLSGTSPQCDWPHGHGGGARCDSGYIPVAGQGVYECELDPDHDGDHSAVGGEVTWPRSVPPVQPTL